MSFWILLRHTGTVISLIKAIGSIIGTVAEKKAPEKILIKQALDAVEELLDSGVIDIPNVDEAAVSEALKQIEAHLMGEK